VQRLCKPPNWCIIKIQDSEVKFYGETKKDRRAEMQEILKKLDIKDMADINELFKEMAGTVLENGLESELDEELGYSKYDYKNRETGNY